MWDEFEDGVVREICETLVVVMMMSRKSDCEGSGNWGNEIEKLKGNLARVGRRVAC